MRAVSIALVVVGIGCGSGASKTRDGGRDGEIDGHDAGLNADHLVGQEVGDARADRLSVDVLASSDAAAEVVPVSGDAVAGDGLGADVPPDRSATVDAPSDRPLSDSPGPDGGQPDNAPVGPSSTDSRPVDLRLADGPGSNSDMAASDAASLEAFSSVDGAAADGGAGAASSQACSSAGWCWEHPLPTGNDLNAILVRSASDVWVAGWFGTLLHWDGNVWAQSRVGSDYLWALSAEPASGSTPGTVWVVGAGGLAARFTGQAWTATDTATQVALRGVSAVGTDQVYAVGEGGTVLFWDGQSWTPLVLADASGTETRDLLAVWGSSPDDVWIGGSNGALWHKQGTVWNKPVPGSSNAWSGIAGSSASNVWMINDSGALMRWNGTTLSTARPSQVFAPIGIWVGTDSDVWVARYQSIEHWDGASWSSLSVSYSLTALAGSASNQVWGAGQRGAIARWNGRTWSQPSSQSSSSQLPYGVTSVWASGFGDVWMSSLHFIYHWDGQSVTSVSSPGTHDIHGLWGSAANDVWAAGANGEIQHWDGARWTLSTGTGTGEFDAISGSSASDIWAVGLHSAYHYDGASWSLKNTGLESTALLAVYAAGPGQAWAGGFNDLVVRWNGTSWIKESLPGSTQSVSNQTIAGSGPTDVWAFGEQAYHFDGTGWRAVAGVPIAQHAWGAGPSNWWGIVAGEVYHYDGTSWSPAPVDASLPVCLAGFGTDAWIGASGGLLHRKGGFLP